MASLSEIEFGREYLDYFSACLIIMSNRFIDGYLLTTTLHLRMIDEFKNAINCGVGFDEAIANSTKLMACLFSPEDIKKAEVFANIAFSKADELLETLHNFDVAF